MTRIHIIVNPKAGRGRAKHIWAKVQQEIPSLTADSVVISHSIAGDEYPFQDLPRDTILVTLGGDGSVHTVGAIALAYGFRFAVIPSGTGNDFAKNTGIHQATPPTLKQIITGAQKEIDVLYMNDHPVLNVAGFGLDAEVVDYIESHPWLKRLGGIGYALSLPVILKRHRRFTVDLTMGDVRRTYSDVSIVVFANAPAFGGGMRICPAADLADGEFNLCLVSGLSKLSILRLFLKIYKGTHVLHPCVLTDTGTQATIRFPDHQRVGDYDGEPAVADSLIQVQVAHNRLKLIIPAHESLA